MHAVNSRYQGTYYESRRVMSEGVAPASLPSSLSPPLAPPLPTSLPRSLPPSLSLSLPPSLPLGRTSSAPFGQRYNTTDTRFLRWASPKTPPS